KIPLHVTVLDSPDVHAIALPGGFLFVSSGLIRAAQTETELAGVVAHEIARIAARHGTRSSKRSVSKLFVPVAKILRDRSRQELVLHSLPGRIAGVYLIGVSPNSPETQAP